MKQLILIRHSKAEAAGFFNEDAERNLTADGIRLAKSQADRLVQKGIQLDAIVCSSSKRTRQTANIFSDAFHLSDENIFITDTLYQADRKQFLEVIKNLDNRFEHVAIVGHNPGITDTANELCELVRIDHMPVCSIFSVTSKLEHWKHFTPGDCLFDFFQEDR